MQATMAQVAERRSKAVQMRVDGYSLEAVALSLEYDSTAEAANDITRALEEAIAAQVHTVDVYREIEVRRLDQMLLALHPGIQRGTPRAIEIALKVAERRAKLLGLDSATKLELTTIDAVDQQIALLTEELARQAAAMGADIDIS